MRWFLLVSAIRDFVQTLVRVGRDSVDTGGGTMSEICRETSPGKDLLILAVQAHPEIRREDWSVAYELENHERTGRFQLICERGEGDVFFPGHWVGERL